LKQFFDVFDMNTFIFWMKNNETKENVDKKRGRTAKKGKNSLKRN